MLKNFAKKYKLLYLLGTGGMSEVFLAQDTKTGTKVAIKILDKKLSKDPDNIKRFKREVEISKTLSHSNIVKIISYGTDRGSNYIVYEYIEGQTLDKFIKSKKLSIKEIEDITLQILQGLSYSHSKDIIHRDIKPSNIMISKGKVKILDFGIARASTRSTITKTGLFMGSPHYASPEQIDGKSVNKKTDIYSFGIILYEMISGSLPFDGDGILSIISAHLSKPTPKLPKSVPHYLSEIVYRCLAKKPDNRFSSVDEIKKMFKDKSFASETVIKDLRVDKPKKDHYTPPAKVKFLNTEKVWIAIGSVAAFLIIISIIVSVVNSANRETVSNYSEEAAAEEAVEAAEETAPAEEEVVLVEVVGVEAVEEGVLEGKIAFTSYYDGDGEIYIMDYNSDIISQLTNNDLRDWGPRFSPDGSRVAFISDRDEGDEIYIMNSDGSNVTQLTNNDSRNWGPCFSPYGIRIVFYSRSPGNKIYIMNSDGSNIMQFTDDSSSCSQPAWSPDGSKIAFSSQINGDTGDWEICVMNPNRSNFVQLTDNNFNCSQPAWSPDGSKILFTADRDGDNEIYIMDSNGGSVIQLTNNDFDDRSPSWSPDGSKIVFMSNYKLSIMNYDGSNIVKIIDNGRDPSWSR